MTGTRPANIYVAVDSARDPHLSTKILQVDYACKARPWDQGSNARRLQRGGKVVKVGVYYDGQVIGYIWYSHIETSRAIGSNYNVAVSRWGGSVGTAGSAYTAVDPDGNGPAGKCWTGRHIHIEAANASGQSCYWSGLDRSPAVSRGPGDYIGYVGYQDAGTRACPSSI